MIEQLAQTYPVSLVCAVWNFPRSTFYQVSRRADDSKLRHTLEQAATEWPMYGSRRLTAQLCRQGWKVNRKRIQRLMREMGLLRVKKRKKRRTTQSQHAFPRYPNLVQNLAVMRPNQVWVADITYIVLQDECVYLAIVMDVFTRTIRGWHLGRSLDERLTLMAWHHALKQGRPEIHHSDQGVQYAATQYVQVLHDHNVQISMSEIGAATQNGYAERVIRTIKEEAVQLSEYRDYHDAFQQIGHFIEEVYNRKRIHSALGYLAPIEFENAWRAQPSAACVVMK